MKTRSKSVSLYVALLTLNTLLAGCTQPTEPDPPPPAQNPRPAATPTPLAAPPVVAPPPAPPAPAPPVVQPPPQAPPTPATTAVMDWSLSDACNDGRGIGVRLFDKSNSLVWPGASQYWRAAAGGSVDVRISCQRGARICFGAATDPQTSTYWGIGLDGNRGCDSCCFQCNDVRVARSLTCG